MTTADYETKRLKDIFTKDRGYKDNPKLRIGEAMNKDLIITIFESSENGSGYVEITLNLNQDETQQLLKDIAYLLE